MSKSIDSESVTVANKLTMVSVVVSDMKRAKEFYAEKLGLEVATDYRQNDNNWWVTLTLPGGGASLTSSASAEKAMNKGDSAAIKRVIVDSCMGKLQRE